MKKEIVICIVVVLFFSLFAIFSDKINFAPKIGLQAKKDIGEVSTLNSAQITFKMVSSDPTIDQNQKFYLWQERAGPEIEYTNFEAFSHTLEVNPGTYIFQAYNHNIITQEGVEERAVILTSEPITLEIGESVDYVFNLDSASKILIDDEILCPESSYKAFNTLRVIPQFGSGIENGGSGNFANCAFSHVYVNEPIEGDRIVIDIATFESSSAPSEIYSVRWILDDFSELPEILPLEDLVSYEAEFRDTPNGVFNFLNVGPGLISNSQTPFVSELNVYLEQSESVSPNQNRINWFTAQGQTKLSPLPTSIQPDQTILVGSSEINDVEPPGIPSGLDLAGNSPLSFSWNAVTDLSGVSYQVIILSENENKVYYSEMFIDSTNFILSDEIENGAYIFGVRAIDGIGNFGEFSEPLSFTA